MMIDKSTNMEPLVLEIFPMFNAEGLEVSLNIQPEAVLHTIYFQLYYIATKCLN